MKGITEFVDDGYLMTELVMLFPILIANVKVIKVVIYVAS